VVSFGFSRFFCLFRPNRSFPSIDALLSICHFSSTESPVALEVLVRLTEKSVQQRDREKHRSLMLSPIFFNVQCKVFLKCFFFAR
jgi:hypothetical protein